MDSDIHILVVADVTAICSLNIMCVYVVNHCIMYCTPSERIEASLLL